MFHSIYEKPRCEAGLFRKEQLKRIPIAIAQKIPILYKSRILSPIRVMNLKSLIPALILTANLVSQVEAKLTSTKEALTQTITSAPQQEKRTIKERDAYCRERLDNAD
jgi:hypothetical protein